MRAERRPHLRDSNFKESVVLSFAGWHAPVFLVALNKLHTHFVLSELDQEPKKRSKHIQAHTMVAVLALPFYNSP